MNDASPRDACAVTIGGVPPADAFGLSLTIDGEDVMATAFAPGPGIFRTRRSRDGADIAGAGRRLPAGAIVGVLQRGPLALPVLMPEEGWPVASAPDGTRVQHGTPVVRFIRAAQAVVP
jgi:hypothetical protein